MLDTLFGTAGDRKQAKTDLRTLLSQVRSEGEALRSLLRQANGAVAAMAGNTNGALAPNGSDAAAAGRIDRLEAQVAELRQQLEEARAALAARAEPALPDAAPHETLQALASAARDAHASLQAVHAGAVKDIESKLAGLAQVHALGKGTDEQLASLNALAEHVMLKSKALATQQQTVEHAVVEAKRLNEMVWAMDGQIARLADGRDQMQRAEEAVAQMEQLAAATTSELAAASAARDAFVRESERLAAQGRALADGLRGSIENLSLEKQALEALDQRVKSLATALDDTESRVQGVLAREAQLGALQQQADSLGKAFSALTAEAEALAHQQGGLATLAQQLGRVEALGTRTAAQHQALLQSQQDLTAAREQLAAFHTGTPP